MSIRCWVVSSFYDFCSFWSYAVNTLDEPQLLIIIFIANYSKFSCYIFRIFRQVITIFHFHHLRYSQTVFETLQFSQIFNIMAATILDFENAKFYCWRVEVHHCTKFCQYWTIHYWDITQFSICQDGGRAPSWIYLEYIWTTHEEYLVISITTQNLAAVGAVV